MKFFNNLLLIGRRLIIFGFGVLRVFLGLDKSSDGVFEFWDDFLLSIDFLKELEVDLFGHFEALFDLAEFHNFGLVIGLSEEDLGGLIALFL